jgi:RNA polymerase-binding transcription factor DksA
VARASKPTSKTAAKTAPKSPAKGSKPAKAKPKAAKAAAKKKPAPVARAAKPKAVAAKQQPSKKAQPKKPVAKPEPAKVAAKAAPPPKPKKKAKPEVTARDIAKIKERLLQQRAEYQKEYADLEEGSLLTSQSESSGEASFDEEYADAGSYTFEREKALSIGNNIRDLLDKVGHALTKIEAGTYGICDNCGNPIAKARVLALPHSSLCLSCKQIEERTR